MEEGLAGGGPAFAFRFAESTLPYRRKALPGADLHSPSDSQNPPYPIGGRPCRGRIPSSFSHPSVLRVADSCYYTCLVKKPPQPLLKRRVEAGLPHPSVLRTATFPHMEEGLAGGGPAFAFRFAESTLPYRRKALPGRTILNSEY